ncbi:MAG: hypothetical protein HOV68_09765 [Streptomycetaceae bacterium]|nr:hypothetical protein [Streptomycetaceae bacterium]
MPHDNLARRARHHALLTGRRHGPSLAAARQLAPETPLVATASPAQALLEGRVFDKLRWPSTSTIFPFGIAWVDATRPDTSTIALEGDRMVAEVVTKLLPSQRRGSQDGSGLAGVRVDRIDEHVHLRTVDGSARLRLTGFDPALWQHHTAAQRELILAERGRWYTAPDTLEPGERAHHRRTAHGRRDWDAVAWMTSALLRRVGLFTTVGLPLWTTAWSSGIGGQVRYCIEMMYGPGTDPRHDQFVERLTDPVHGLPMDVERTHCARHRMGRYCTVDLITSDGRPGALNLRFREQTTDFMASFAVGSPREYQEIQRRWGNAGSSQAFPPVDCSTDQQTSPTGTGKGQAP